MFLTAEEEYDLARRYRGGDGKAAHKLACAYLPLVKRIAGEFYGPAEDLISEGCVGLMKAIKRFNPEQGARLGTYAVFWIRAEILEYCRRDIKMASLNKPVCEEGVEEIDLLADERDDQEQLLAQRQERRRQREFLRKALNGLAETERQIIVERRLLEYATPLKALGERYGVSGERIRQMEMRIMEGLKAEGSAIR